MTIQWLNKDMKIDVQPENTCMHLNYTVIEMFRNEQFFANPLKEHTCLCHPDRNYCKSFFEASFFHSNASLDRKNLEAVKIFIVDTYKTEKAF